MIPAVELRGATKRYGKFTALDEVSLTVRPGEIFGLLGPNGAGKTTLISLVAGTARPTSGQVQVMGHDVVSDYETTRRLVGLVPQEINFDPFFTVEEALEFQAGYFGLRLEEDRLMEILQNLGLADKRHANSRALSGGMKRRLLIAKALVHRPSVLFLDEPTAGVDVELRRDLWTYVRRLRAQGTTVVLTTHYLEEAEELADRIGVIKNGRILLVEDKSALLARYGKRRVKLSLGAKVTQLTPRALAAGALLVEGGAAVELHPVAGASLEEPLRALVSDGLAVVDLQTSEPRLESVLVELLHEDPAQKAQQPAPGQVATAPAQRRLEVAKEGARPQAAPSTAPLPSQPGLGFRTLFRKEVKRFLRVPGQTLFSPLITTVLYFLVFGYSLGGRLREVDGVPYIHYLVPGLIMLGVVNNAFLNTSSSMFILKMQGTIIDLLVTPLTHLEVLGAFVAAGVTRAMIVASLTWLTAVLFVGPAVPHPILALAACLLVAATFACGGFIVALWADKFEQVNFIPTFVITPLIFLGGVFYSASMLPPVLRAVLKFNPLFYMIELLRHGLLGTSGGSLWLGAAILIALFGALVGSALTLLRSGYKLRS